MTKGRMPGTREDAQEVARIQKRFQQVFATGDGPWVLDYIKRMLGEDELSWELEPGREHLRDAYLMILEAAGWNDAQNSLERTEAILKTRQINPVEVVSEEEGDQ